MKNKIATIGIIIATLILAGVAVFTAIRLYQLRKESVAPTAPTSKPKAQEVPVACTSLAFTLGVTPTPTSTPTPTPTGTPSATATSTPTATPTNPPGEPTPTATPRSTATQVAKVPATGEPALPDAGISLPTIFGIGLGTLLLIGAILLAI
mgnify:CR=1 FL=1